MNCAHGRPSAVCGECHAGIAPPAVVRIGDLLHAGRYRHMVDAVGARFGSPECALETAMLRACIHAVYAQLATLPHRDVTISRDLVRLLRECEWGYEWLTQERTGAEHEELYANRVDVP